jgi:hypothetical protein
MRGKIIKLVLLAAVSVLMLQGATAWANTISVPLSQTSFGDMVVDDANDHVLISSPSNNSIAVFDFNGNLVTTITGVPDAYGMVIVGTTLYVAEDNADAIEGIDLTTFADEGHVATGLDGPQWLAYADGRLWTNDNDANGFEDFDSVTLDGHVTPFYFLEGGTFKGAFLSPQLAASPATPNVLYVSDFEGTVHEYDVSSGTPVQLASSNTSGAESGINDMVVSSDGTRLFPATSPFRELSASTLEDDGNTYQRGASAVAVSPANDGLLAIGVGNSGPLPADISVYRFGVPTATFMASTGYYSDVDPHGLALNSDGSRLFAVTGGTSFHLWSFDLSGAPTTGSDYTWAATSGPDSFSDAADWSTGESPPTEDVGTLAFPNLTGNCGSCDRVIDDIDGLTVNKLDVDADIAYQIVGSPTLTLGSGGINVSSPSGNGSPPTFGLPILLAAPQTWTIDEGPVTFTGQIVGNQNLSLGFDNGSVAPTSAEVGDISATGDGGIYLDGRADLNSSSGSSVNVESGAGIEADKTGNSVGPITVGSDGWVSVGAIDNGAGTLAVDGNAAFTSGSELDIAVNAPGITAGADYSQLTTTGNVTLGGTELDVSLGADPSGDCNDLRSGQTLTLVSTSGTITGGFSNYANGASVDIENDCDYAPQDASGTIGYSPHAITLTITSGGDAGEWTNGPIEVVAPSISGSPVVGQTLLASPGGWQQATSFGYSWYACRAATCDQISGATAHTLTLTSAQLGDQIAAVVVAVGPDGSNGDQTALTDTVTEPTGTITTPTRTIPSPPFVPFPKIVPAIRGATVVGSTLSATTGAWTNEPSSYAYRWDRCLNRATSCVAIPGATASTYTLRKADAGSAVEVSVRASNSAGVSPISETSKPTAIISGSGSPTSTTPPGASLGLIKNDLRGLLKPTGKTASLQAVLAHHSYAFSVRSPGRGKLTVTWTAKVRNRTVTFAKVSMTISGAHKVNVPVRLTGTGTLDLKRYPHLKIKTEVGFKAAGLKQVNESATFTLARPKKAHASSALAPKQFPRAAFTHRS